MPVALKRSQRGDELGFDLRNDGDHPIYLSYTLPEEGKITSKFVAYVVERKRTKEISNRMATVFILYLR
jgi:hypothetical protein